MPRDGELIAGCFLGLFSAFLMFAALAFMADLGARETFQEEAVQHGAARWIVDDEGRREFVWNEGEDE